MNRRVLIVGLAASLLVALAPAHVTAAVPLPVPDGLVGNPPPVGLADMYPVDVTDTASHYYVVDPGRYRVVAVNRSTSAIDFAVGGHQGKLPAEFAAPRSVSTDASGNIYVADTANNRVQKFNAQLQTPPLKVFGTTGAGNGQFKLAYGVAVGPGLGAGGSPAEVVYVSDQSGRVQKFDTDGNFISVFKSGINSPRQMTVDPATRNLLVVAAKDLQTIVFSQTGAEVRRIGVGKPSGTGPGQFREDPRGVAMDSAGRVYMSDDGNRRVQVFSSTGAYLTEFGKTGAGQMHDPRGLAATSDGKIIATDEWAYSMKEWTVSGTGAGTTVAFARQLFGTGPDITGFNSPRGLATDASGRVYVVDWWNQLIHRFDANGTPGSVVAWGFRGNSRQPGSLNFPWDVAIRQAANSTNGYVYVANREGHEIEVFDANGVFKTRWGLRGTGTATDQFQFPQGIAFDPTNGTLLVTDSSNHRIVRIAIDSTGKGTQTAVYGSFGNATSPAGKFNLPTGISVASDGTIWVADTQNARIQKRSPAGAWTIYSTVFTASKFSGPRGVTVGPDGNIWVADSGANRIVLLDTNGTTIFAKNGTALGLATNFDSPFKVALSPDGDQVYVSDTWNNRVLKFTYDG